MEENRYRNRVIFEADAFREINGGILLGHIRECRSIDSERMTIELRVGRSRASGGRLKGWLITWPTRAIANGRISGLQDAEITRWKLRITTRKLLFRYGARKHEPWRLSRPPKLQRSVSPKSPECTKNVIYVVLIIDPFIFGSLA